ncbi:MAG: cysteine rich repeat-containing protein, partial [Stellaceae bacterium]
AAAAPAPAPAAPRTPREQVALLRQACGYDYRRFCRGVPFGGGRVASCLEGNADRVTPNCGRALSSLRQAR